MTTLGFSTRMEDDDDVKFWERCSLLLAMRATRATRATGADQKGRPTGGWTRGSRPVGPVAAEEDPKRGNERGGRWLEG